MYCLSEIRRCYGFLLLLNLKIIVLSADCTNDEVACGTAFCLPSKLMCNGVDDCGDNTDETTACGR